MASCKSGAFSCPLGSTCDAKGQCVDACTQVSCAPASACRNGQCVDQPCANVTCTYGKRCELGQCVDLCEGVTCPGDRVCDQGQCVANCSCAGCDAGLTCAASGHCIDSACAAKSCPTGQTCLLGACIGPSGGNSGSEAGQGGMSEAGERGTAGAGAAPSVAEAGESAGGVYNGSAGITALGEETPRRVRTTRVARARVAPTPRAVALERAALRPPRLHPVAAARYPVTPNPTAPGRCSGSRSESHSCADARAHSPPCENEQCGYDDSHRALRSLRLLVPVQVVALGIAIGFVRSGAGVVA